MKRVSPHAKAVRKPRPKRKHFHTERITVIKDSDGKGVEQERPSTKPDDRIILSTILELTPPNCLACSTREAAVNLTENGVKIGVHPLGYRLSCLRDKGYLKMEKEHSYSLWSLTAAGKRFLSQR
ncbi:MAG: hypothetical protein ACKVRP_02465 [Bacteroidota bacterium]